ncbi:hypothetical protein [Pseudomonas panipatensis]|uniref:Uncharacterized protein n=1 Tax=Pseudomonas panipatensis TaxID=428992 RepID=A0A1G8BX41_9PSED|nr:hypothetical protein [Pseudomonas panipatensis]SDH37777.1 hypothetical protein SAMN05216272_101276 [Pseudomonas panipatensis]SMP66898.1 hypothetical protein SAMN06295951_107240 [Pseudomonas panipatensis]
MTSSEQPPRDDSAENAPDKAPLSLAELAKAALAAQKNGGAGFQPRKAHDKDVRRPPAPRGSRRSMGKR